MPAVLSAILLVGLLLTPAVQAQSGTGLSREGWTGNCLAAVGPGVKDPSFYCTCLYEGLVREVPVEELQRAADSPAPEREAFFTSDPRVVTVETGCGQLDATFGGKPLRDASIEAFIAKEGFYTFQLTTDGVYYHLSKAGEGPRAVAGSTVTLKYKALPTSSEVVVASSDIDGVPLTMKVGAGQMIRGMELGLPLFAKGGVGVLLLPYWLAYGERGLPPAVPPRSTFLMEIEVLDIR